MMTYHDAVHPLHIGIPVGDKVKSFLVVLPAFRSSWDRQLYEPAYHTRNRLPVDIVPKDLLGRKAT